MAGDRPHPLAAGLPLRGRLVEIDRFGRSDLTDRYVGWLNDPLVVRFSNQRFRQHTRATCDAYLRSFDGTDNLFLSVRDSSGQALGTMTAYYAAPHRTVDVGILIGARESWGQGIGQDAWTTVIDWLAGKPAVRKITAGTLAVNLGMIRLMERSGMSPDGARVGQELVDGRPVDIVHYARFV